MFDPNVSNPLVIEKGAEEFGMIAKMDTIMSAAIYHDLEAMDRLQQRKFVSIDRLIQCCVCSNELKGLSVLLAATALVMCQITMITRIITME